MRIAFKPCKSQGKLYKSKGSLMVIHFLIPSENLGKIGKTFEINEILNSSNNS